MCLTHTGRLYYIHETIINFCCYIFLCWISWPLQFLFLLTCVWLYCIVGSFHIGGPSCWRYLEVSQFRLQGSNMVVLLPQLSRQVPIFCSNIGKSCIPGCCCWCKLNENVFHFTMFYIVSAPTARCYWRLFELYISWHASWKCALNHTHVQSLDLVLFHMQYACLYSCVTRIFVLPMSSSCQSKDGEFPAIADPWPVSIWLSRLSIDS